MHDIVTMLTSVSVHTEIKIPGCCLHKLSVVNMALGLGQMQYDNCYSHYNIWLHWEKYFTPVKAVCSDAIRLDQFNTWSVTAPSTSPEANLKCVVSFLRLSGGSGTVRNCRISCRLMITLSFSHRSSLLLSFVMSTAAPNLQLCRHLLFSSAM